MEAKELRIGNWINVTFSSIVKQQVVDCMCDSVNTKCHESLQFDFIEPIPLTEEWLLKFGFFGKYFFCVCAFCDYNSDFIRCHLGY